jgi:hypothetical protein
MDGVRGQLGLVFQQSLQLLLSTRFGAHSRKWWVQLVTLFFTLCLSIFLFAYVD